MDLQLVRYGALATSIDNSQSLYREKLFADGNENEFYRREISKIFEKVAAFIALF